MATATKKADQQAKASKNNNKSKGSNNKEIKGTVANQENQLGER
jgi:hypothetical protein